MTGLDSFPDQEFEEIRLINRERGYNLARLDLNETLQVLNSPESAPLIKKILDFMAMHEEIRKRSGYNDSKE